MAVEGATPPGGGAGETARHLAACFHALRELVHGSCRWLALEPRLDVKYALADQIHDDARSARAVSRRLHELRPPLDASRPGPALAALLDSLSSAGSADAYLRIAYGELKPRLAATVEQRVAATDPWRDEPSLRVLIELRHRQRYHLADLPATGARAAAAGAPLEAEPTGGRARRLRPQPPIEAPARDGYVAVVSAAASIPSGARLIEALGRTATTKAAPTGGPASSLLHALMHERVCWAEVATRTSHEHPELPGAFHLDMAKLAWDASRHAQALERLLGRFGAGHWGQDPVSLAEFRSLYRPQLDERLARMRDAARERLERRPGIWSAAGAAPAAGDELRETVDLLLADDQDHFECLADWGKRLGGAGAPGPDAPHSSS